MLPLVLPVVALTGSTAPRFHRQVQVEPSDSSECKVVAEGGERRSVGGSDSAEEGGHTTCGGGGWIETRRSFTHSLVAPGFLFSSCLSFLPSSVLQNQPEIPRRKKLFFFLFCAVLITFNPEISQKRITFNMTRERKRQSESS